MMSNNENRTQNRAQNRRFIPRIRFGLRTLFLLVTVFSIWLGIRWNRANNQRLAVAAIQAEGGSVHYDYEFDLRTGKAIPDAKPWGPSWLRNMLSIDFFHHVVIVHMFPYEHFEQKDRDQSWLERNRRGRAVAAHLQHLPRIRWLSLYGSQVNPNSVEHILKMRRLEYLGVFPLMAEYDGRLKTLQRPEITDEHVARLKALPHLKFIQFRDAPIGDESLRLMAAFPAFEQLSIFGGRFSDRGLQNLGIATRRHRDYSGRRSAISAGQAEYEVSVATV